MMAAPRRETYLVLLPLGLLLLLLSSRHYQVSSFLLSHTWWCHHSFPQQRDVVRSAFLRRRRGNGRSGRTTRCSPAGCCVCLAGLEEEGEEEWSDFDGFVGDSFDSDFIPSNVREEEKQEQAQPSSASTVDDDDEDSAKNAELLLGGGEFQERLAQQQQDDLTGIQTRQFSLGPDVILTDFVGKMGFEEVTDWEYYYPSEDNDERRQVVQPNPFDDDKAQQQPKRTRTASGGVVRLFRGELAGVLGGTLSAQGRDKRVLIKEFGGNLAEALARNELASLASLQSKLLYQRQQQASRRSEDDNESDPTWTQVASARSVLARQDNAHVLQLLDWLGQSEPYLGILGTVNLAELEGEMEPNEFYRALGVPPPSSDAVWIVYEYAGLNSLQAYANRPPAVRIANLPLQKGFFGNPIPPPPPPPFEERADYVVRGMLKQAIEALAMVHEAGLCHRSIGRSSFLLGTRPGVMDKQLVSGPYATLNNADGKNLQIKLADFGFSGPQLESAKSEEFRARARTFGLSFREGEQSLAVTNFAMAEDLHALGFVFMGVLLSVLAEVEEDASTRLPQTDEDTLQRLFDDIFNKDVKGAFREYVLAEDAWAPLVDLLDDQDYAGWTVLETLLLARENVAAASVKAGSNDEQVVSIRGLLSNPFFAKQNGW